MQIKKIAAVVILIAITGCAEIHAVRQPEEGYRAIKFRSAISVRDHALNLYHFAAGSTFIGDRQTDYGTVYCGQASINDDARLFATCIGLAGDNTIVIGPGAAFKQVERQVPPGTIEITQMKM